MTKAEAISPIITVAMGLIALGSGGLYWVKSCDRKLVTQILFLVFGMFVAAGVLMLLTCTELSFCVTGPILALAPHRSSHLTPR